MKEDNHNLLLHKSEPRTLELLLYKRIRDAHDGNIIETTKLLYILRRSLYFVPNKARFKVLEDMEQCGLIRRINRFKFEIMNGFEKKLESYPLWGC